MTTNASQMHKCKAIDNYNNGREVESFKAEKAAPKPRDKRTATTEIEERRRRSSNKKVESAAAADIDEGSGSASLKEEIGVAEADSKA